MQYLLLRRRSLPLWLGHHLLQKTFLLTCFKPQLTHRLSFPCKVCIDFWVCSKCFGRIDLYHGHFKTENCEPHAFECASEAELDDQRSSSPAPESNIGDEASMTDTDYEVDADSMIESSDTSYDLST